ncbi:unnamed protein product, partial [Effrenium voratum]
ACHQAGADFLEPDESTNLTWTVRSGARWLPPKNVGGRRWYQDEAGMAKYEEEHADPARNLYNELMSGPGGGTALRSRISNAGQQLLRVEAKLDEPDKYGVKKSYPSWGRVDLLLGNVDGFTNYLRSRDTDRVRQAKRGELEPDPTTAGLSQDTLIWVFSLGRKKLMDELDSRQCHHKVISCIDVQSLREALLEELQKEEAYSPTRQGVRPGVIQSLTAEQLKKEREADTNVPLLTVFVDEKSPRYLKFRDELQAAASLLLRAIRIVVVDAMANPSVVKEFATVRFPTLIWMLPGGGAELSREIGVFPASSIVDRTRALVRLKELPEAEVKALAEVGLSRKFRKANFGRPHPQKSASVRSIQGHSKGFWRHGRR